MNVFSPLITISRFISRSSSIHYLAGIENSLRVQYLLQLAKELKFGLIVNQMHEGLFRGADTVLSRKSAPTAS
jgi:hypothetical protein